MAHPAGAVAAVTDPDPPGHPAAHPSTPATALRARYSRTRETFEALFPDRPGSTLRILLGVGSVAAVVYGVFEMFAAAFGVDLMGGPSTAAGYAADIAAYDRGAVIALVTAAAGTGLAGWTRRRALIVLEVSLLLVAVGAAVLFHVSPDIPTYLR